LDYGAIANGLTTDGELVEVDAGTGYRYVFDIGSADGCESRVVAGYGLSRPPAGPRDASRLRGYPVPKTLVPTHDRGHLFAHAAGGAADVNLFVQHRALNQGWSAEGRRWRALERYTARHPGTLMVVRLLYEDTSALPRALEAVLADKRGVIRSERLRNGSAAGS
jgi:hypothetical protein